MGTQARRAFRIPRATPPDGGSSTRWTINGWPFVLTVWSARQWARLDPRPDGAQAAPDGARHLLRAGE